MVVAGAMVDYAKIDGGEKEIGLMIAPGADLKPHCFRIVLPSSYFDSIVFIAASICFGVWCFFILRHFGSVILYGYVQV